MLTNADLLKEITMRQPSHCISASGRHACTTKTIFPKAAKLVICPQCQHPDFYERAFRR